MFLGIDVGTSAVKVVLVGSDQRLIDQASAPLEVQRPRPGWSTQDPETWWVATALAVSELRLRRGQELAAVEAIGLSGQMHGAVLLDDADRVIRPAILWNDGRSGEECRTLESRVPASRRITGNIAMPGFTAPKLLWVAKHEPDLFRRVAHVLLPKDYVRLRLTGTRATDTSDASGTLWLDVGARRWSSEMLAATGLPPAAMPELFEGNQITGQLRVEVADAWGLKKGIPVAAGGGDNAAGAIGAGVVRKGQAFLSLGTSGVYFVADDRFAPYPEGAVHTFCHCLPQTWHQMAVLLSAASCLSWLQGVTGADSEAALVDEASDEGDEIFLPYLSGERTPHNDPHARGVFFGLSHKTTRGDLARAVLEGVAFAFADGQDALEKAGARIDEVTVIGGGARSERWGEILAAVLGRTLTYREGGEVGPAYGAARLARLAASGEAIAGVCTPPPVARAVEPDATLRARLLPRLERFRGLYRNLRASFVS